MRIGIDAHVLGKGVGGVERFLAHLVALLPSLMPQHHFVVFVDRHASQTVALPAGPNVEYVPLVTSNPLIERSVLMPWLVRRHRLQMLLIQRLAPWLCGSCRLVTTVHDITPLKYPADYPGRTNTLIRWLTGNTVDRSQLILTPTQVIADEVSARFEKDGARVVPFYNGVDLDVFHPGVPDTTTPYVFTSGAIEARKNVETLLRAFASVGPAAGWRLRIAGGVRNPAYHATLHALTEQLGLTGHVDWLGFVSEAELVRQYQGALAFVTASRDEGFNIPPLEAMACGTPVLCSDIAVHKELFAGAALFFATESAHDLAAQLARLRDEPELRATLLQRSAECVARYTWPAMAQRVARALQAICH